jgi:hypothetical protein
LLEVAMPLLAVSMMPGNAVTVALPTPSPVWKSPILPVSAIAWVDG